MDLFSAKKYVKRVLESAPKSGWNGEIRFAGRLYFITLSGNKNKRFSQHVSILDMETKNGIFVIRNKIKFWKAHFHLIINGEIQWQEGYNTYDDFQFPAEKMLRQVLKFIYFYDFLNLKPMPELVDGKIEQSVLNDYFNNPNSDQYGLYTLNEIQISNDTYRIETNYNGKVISFKGILVGEYGSPRCIDDYAVIVKEVTQFDYHYHPIVCFLEDAFYYESKTYKFRSFTDK
jgi:hypothetical protein